MTMCSISTLSLSYKSAAVNWIWMISKVHNLLVLTYSAHVDLGVEVLSFLSVLHVLVLSLLSDFRLGS
jgi:hypothetical protein